MKSNLFQVQLTTKVYSWHNISEREKMKKIIFYFLILCVCSVAWSLYLLQKGYALNFWFNSNYLTLLRAFLASYSVCQPV